MRSIRLLLPAFVVAALALAALISASAYGDARPGQPSAHPQLPQNSGVFALQHPAVTPTVTPTATPVAPPAPSRPNIVFVLTDDLTSDLIRYMPHVRAMQQSGTRFTNYFVVDSLCCPSRSAILTGLYPHDNGVFTNSGRDGGYHAFNAHGNRRRTFAVALQQAGYRTGLMGKYLNRYEPTDGVPRGWDEWDVAGDGYNEYDYQLNENGVVRSYGHGRRDYLTDVLNRRASGFISRAAASRTPFALEIAPFAPHQPAVPAPRDVNRFDSLTPPHGPKWDTLPTHAPAWLATKPRLSVESDQMINDLYRHRVEAVQSVDRMVGHLENVLKRAGVADDTYLVFTSDNGFHLGQYRLLPGKQTAFDTDIRVPLVVTGPGVPADRSVTALAGSVDLASTFEQIAGAEDAPPTDGRSLLGLWHGQAAPADWTRAVLIEHHGRRQPLDDPDVQPAGSGIPPSYEAVRTADALFVRYRTGAVEYYDLRRDPDELHNLAAHAPPSVLRPLHRALSELEHCHGAASCSTALAP